MLRLLTIIRVFFQGHGAAILEKIFAKAAVDGTKAVGKKLLKKKAPESSGSDTLSEKLDLLIDQLQQEPEKTNREIAQELKPLVSSLHVDTAYDSLNTLRKTTNIKHQYTLAVIDYLRACCSLYVDQIDAVEEYEQAYREMIGSGRMDPDIQAGMVFVHCFRKEEKDALRLARGLKRLNKNDIWVKIPELVFSQDLDAALAKEPESIRNNVTILYYTTWLRNKNETLGVDIPTFKVTLPQHMCFENIPVWMFNFTVLLNRFLEEWDNMVFEEALEAGPACKELNEYATRFIALKSKTELKDLNSNIKLFYFITSFVIRKDLASLDSILSVEGYNMNDAFRVLAYATFIEKAGKDDNGAKAIMAADGVPLDFRSFHYRFYLASKTGDCEYAVETLKQLVAQGEMMPACYLVFFLVLLVRYPDDLKGFIDKVKIPNGTDTRVFREICRCLCKDSTDVDYLVKNLGATSPCFMPFIAIALHNAGAPDVAINIFDRFAKPDEVGLGPLVYLELLKKNEETVRLDNYLKSRREKGFDRNALFLNEEYIIASKQSDYARALEISEACVKLSPDNNAYLISLLFDLSRNGLVDRIKEIAPRLKDADLSEEEVYTVFGILQEVKLFEESIDFLYTQIESRHPSSERLLILFQDFGTNSNSKSFVCQEYDTVQQGLYVSYTHNGERRDEIFYPGKRTACLEGKKVGESIKLLDKLGREDEYVILSVHNKYKLLLDRINHDIEDNQFDSAFAVSGDDVKKDDSFVDNLRKVLGISEEDEKHRESCIEEYKQGRLSLGVFIKKNETIAGLYERLFGSFFIYSTPAFWYDFKNIHVDGKTFVLDLSALIVLFEIHLKFGIEYEIPLVVPRGIVSLLESTLLEQSSGLCGNVSQEVQGRLRQLDGLTEDSWFTTRVKGLIAWTKEAITIKNVPEMAALDTDEFIGQSIYQMKMIEAFALAYNEDGVLVTDDKSLSPFSSESFPIISTDLILSKYCQGNYPDIVKFLINCGFVGFDIDAEYVIEQYDKYSAGQPSSYLCCKENFDCQILRCQAEIELCNHIYGKTTITDADKQEVESILLHMFEDPEAPGFRGYMNAACMVFPGFKKAIEDVFGLSNDDDDS